MKSLFTKNGNVVPPVGLGTFPMQNAEIASATKNCIQAGYRLIDTSDDYEGEIGIGLGCQELISEGICKREDIFLQTKVSNNDSYNDEPLRAIYFTENSPYMKRHRIEDIVREKVETSLRELQTDYLDSLLIHFPYEPFYIDIWKTLINLQNEGIARYIGVSNFHHRHLDRLIEETGVVPAINEIYLSPIGSKEDQVLYAKEHDIILMTYSPLMDVTRGRIPTDTLNVLAEKYNKTEAQIVLRWNIDRGSIPLPKSANTSRLIQNIDVLDFQLNEEEIKMISSLNKDYQYLPESLNCPGI